MTSADGETAASPFRGKTVVLIHPAWHSCGSYKVFQSQAKAYRALGVELITLAVDDSPSLRIASQRAAYMAASADLVGDMREWAAMPASSIVSPSFTGALGRRVRGDHASLRLEVAKRVPIPSQLSSLPKIDLIHCNHFFCVPVAKRLRAQTTVPIVVETHDIQAHQYDQQVRGRWLIPPRIAFDTILAVELAELQSADLLIHMNGDEDAFFRSALASKQHALLYPGIEPVIAARRGGKTMLIVAAANHANYQSIDWFLRHVLPLAKDVPIKIAGNIDMLFRRRSPALFQKHAKLFAGRVDDLESLYREAAAIVLPTVAGQGISIKTIEALSSGARLIATPVAFRGMDIDPVKVRNVRLASDAESFARALRETAATDPDEMAAHDARTAYAQWFSHDAYCAGLKQVVGPLLMPQTTT